MREASTEDPSEMEMTVRGIGLLNLHESMLNQTSNNDHYLLHRYSGYSENDVANVGLE